jgi:hypothetical protein
LNTTPTGLKIRTASVPHVGQATGARTLIDRVISKLLSHGTHR